MRRSLPLRLQHQSLELQHIRILLAHRMPFEEHIKRSVVDDLAAPLVKRVIKRVVVGSLQQPFIYPSSSRSRSVRRGNPIILSHKGLKGRKGKDEEKPSTSET